MGADAADAAVALVGRGGGSVHWAAAGRTRRRGGRDVEVGDRFDLASLSKPFAATVALVLDRRRELRLSTTLGDIWGSRVDAGLADRSLEELLRHRSGLGAWTPLYQRFRSRREAEAHLLRGTELESRRERYSDLGYILWGLSAERALGESYQSLLSRFVTSPLRLLSADGPPGSRSDVVACRLDNSRERSLARAQGRAVALRRGPRPGRVQDGNARFLRGPYAHAGLFASAADVYGLARAWLSPGRLLAPSAVRRALTGGRSYALGWARATRRGSAGPALGPEAFGHVGFTGSSVWIDPSEDRILVLLAHRPSVAVDLSSWRRRFHRAAVELTG